MPAVDCQLEPVVEQEPDHGQNKSSRLLQLRNRLPVIVLFHSRRYLEGDFDDSTGTTSPDRLEDEDDSNSSEQGRRWPHSENRKPEQTRDRRRVWWWSSASKPNSLAHLELARRANSIVITFNYRIGLLGYLPYTDLEDQQPGGGGSGELLSHGTTRSNHALWDQIGLLHWIRHNVAHFNGEPANVSLMAADSNAVGMVQLLALSSKAKGLFKRLILVHDKQTDQSNDDDHPDRYFARLFQMAQRARHLQRKLISELGLILERGHEFSLKNSPANQSDWRPDSEFSHATLGNFEIDRRVSEFLKLGQLDQLARVEHELAKVNVNVAQPLTSELAAGTQTVRLLDVIQSPNLDDKLLFPYFSLLIRANNKSLDQFSSDLAPTRGFWPWLRANLDEQRQQLELAAPQTAQQNSTRLQTIQLEAEYCRYMRQLYAQMFANRHDHFNGLLASELKRVDPLKLIPRVSDHQLMMIMMANGHNGTESTGPMAGQGELKSLKQNSTKWRHRNRTANALDFYHLRHAHLLQQLLVQRLDGQNKSTTSGPEGGSPDRRQDNNDDDQEEDELDDQLVTRLQRQQQQRSIMLTQHGQQSGQDQAPGSYSLLRSKRHTTSPALDQAAALLGQQLIELLGSFDLLVLFAASPFDDSVNKLSTLNDQNSGLLRSVVDELTPVRNGTNLSESLVSYLQMADLHHVAAIRSSPGHLNSLCEFSSSANAALKLEQLTHSTEGQFAGMDFRSSSFVMLTPDLRLAASDKLAPDEGASSGVMIMASIGQFASTGRLEQQRDEQVPAKTLPIITNQPRPFDTLDRQIYWPLGGSNLEQALLKNLVSVHFNLVPYLRRVLKVTRERHSKLGDLTIASHRQEHFLEQPLMPAADLISCLGELDSVLTSSEPNGKQRLLTDEPTLVRLREESPCLLNATNRLRLQLRAGASDELEPLVRQYFVINEQQRQRQQRQQQSQTPTRSSPESAQPTSSDQKRLQVTLQTTSVTNNQHGDRRVSSMTTRNLVNQSEGLYLDQLSSATSTLASGAGSQQLERELALLGNNNDRLDLVNLNAAKTSPPNGGGIRGFFAKTYKDAMGQALGIVVGTGLLIFLLNLVIVLVIALRSRHNLRRARRNTRQPVQDSSLAIGTEGNNSHEFTQHQIAAGRQSAEPNDLPLCQRATFDSALCDSSLSTGHNQQASNLEHLTRLQSSTSSFKVHQNDLCQMQSPLSSNSQRIPSSKSIKFDLSSAQDVSAARKVTPTVGHGQRSIMKQPATTSDEDELRMIEAQTLVDANHYHQCQSHHHHHHHQLEPCQLGNGFAQEIAISPVSLDVLDLIPLDNLNGGYESHRFVASNSSDDYQQAAALAHCGGQLISNKQMGTKCHLHDNNQNQVNRQQKNQFTGGGCGGNGSLTSPFGSQSTHSTNSAPNANGNHFQNMINLNLNSFEFSPRRAVQQNTFHAGQIGLLNSPTSSATISGAQTPSLITSQQQHSSANGPVTINGGSYSIQKRDSNETFQVDQGDCQMLNFVYGVNSLARRGGRRDNCINLEVNSLEGGQLIMLPAESNQQQQTRDLH